MQEWVKNLMIGDLVYVWESGEKRIHEWSLLDYTRFQSSPFKVCAPIPLTQEFIGKFDGAIQRELDFYFNVSRVEDSVLKLCVKAYSKISVWLDNDYNYVDVYVGDGYYVHDLQQLYYSLKKEKLKLKGGYKAD